MDIDQIKKDCQRRLRRTMQVANREAEEIIDGELWDYYSGTTPKVYQRTGTLGNAGIVTPVEGSGDECHFSAGINEGISYTTGTYSGIQVIDATDQGHSGTIGNHGYWERIQEELSQAVNQAFSQQFD